MIDGVRNGIKELGLINKVTLSVLRTSNRSDSDSYIERKKKILESTGIEFKVHNVCGYNRKDLMNLIAQLNSDSAVQGILIQFPLGEDLKGQSVKCEELMEMVDWKKDVDGFHPLNLVNSATLKGNDYFVSCTPKGVMRLLKEMEIDLQGLDVVLIGKSRVVGIPLLHQLLARGSSVQICHKSTLNLAEKCRQAQIVIVAAGSPKLVKADWIRPGAIVIDIGTNYDASGRLIGGDVDFHNVEKVAGFVTPVPGGIGPLTIAALAENVLKSAIINKRARD